MIKLIKLCLVCCLMLSATFAKEVDAYDVLRKIDEEFWENTISPYYQDQLGRYDSALIDLFSPEWVIAQNTFEYFEGFYKYRIPQLFGEPPHVDFSWIPVLDFSQASMLDIISGFYEILERKVAYRDEEYVINEEGNIQKITFNEQGFALTEAEKKIIDPYFTKIKIGNKEYHLHLDYAGEVIKKQPGNCCLRQKSDSMAKAWCNYGSYSSTLNDNDHYVLQNLLLCLEVSRRMIKNGNQPDAYHELPILGAIVIGLELMNDQIIDKNDFFVTGRNYCCFSSLSKDSVRNYIDLPYRILERENHIKNLLGKFIRYKNFKSVEQFKKEVQRLYKQFIGLKVTDRVLYLDENYPSVIQKYPYCKLMTNVNRDLINNKYHIVDINRTNDNMCFAVKQCMNPKNYYDQEEESMPFTIEGKNLKDKIKFLEKNFLRKVIILDATGKIIKTPEKFAIFLSTANQKLFSNKFEYILKNCRESKIILLWRGNHWQAVLPNE